MKVLLTGATGYIGSHLVPALVARGDHVTALVREASRVEQLRELGCQLYQGDLRGCPGPGGFPMLSYHGVGPPGAGAFPPPGMARRGLP